MTDLYFAYGSNMNTERVAERGLEVVDALSGRLHDFRLAFDKASRRQAGVGHASIHRAPGQVVEGVLYRLTGAAEILKMDRFESAPVNYGRDVVAVQTATGTAWAWTYFANAAVLKPGLKPSEEYLEHLLAGEVFLSSAYHARLTRWPTVDGTG